MEIRIKPSYFGLVIEPPLPDSFLSQLKDRFGKNVQRPDMEELNYKGIFGVTDEMVKGWYYDIKLIQFLLDNKHTVIYRGTIIQNVMDIVAIDELEEKNTPSGITN